MGTFKKVPPNKSSLNISCFTVASQPTANISLLQCSCFAGKRLRSSLILRSLRSLSFRLPSSGCSALLRRARSSALLRKAPALLLFEQKLRFCRIFPSNAPHCCAGLLRKPALDIVSSLHSSQAPLAPHPKLLGS